MLAAALSHPYSEQNFISHRQMDENCDEDPCPSSTFNYSSYRVLKAWSFSQMVALPTHSQLLTAVFVKVYKDVKIKKQKRPKSVKAKTTNHVMSRVAGQLPSSLLEVSCGGRLLNPDCGGLHRENRETPTTRTTAVSGLSYFQIKCVLCLFMSNWLTKE